MSPLDFRKVFYHTDNLIELKQTGDSWPITMKVGLTTFCNHRCVFCQVGHASVDGGGMLKSAVIDLDVLLKFLKQAGKHGLKAITICGEGEPLLYPHIDKLFEEVRKLGIEIGLFTNGALLNETRRKFIAEYATWIRFSINGSNVEEHNMVHQCNGDFPKIVENIRALLELRKSMRKTLPTVGTQMVIYEENYKSIYEATKLWRDIGVDYFEIKPLLPVVCDLENPVTLTKNKDEVRRLMKMAEELQDDNFKVYAKYGLYAAQIKPITKNYDKCFVPALFGGYLKEDGDLGICCDLAFDPDKILGNINEQSFEEIWTSERRKKILQELNVHKCPPACTQHKLAEILWDYLYPKKENHINFL